MLAALLMHQVDVRRPTPSNGKSNGGICPAYDAECGKVPNMVVACDCKQKSGITDHRSVSLKRKKGVKNKKHTNTQFHQENIRYT